MSERGKQLALLLGATLALGGCAVAASPALTLGGDRQAAGEAMRLSERGAQLVGIGYAVISVQNHSNPEQRRLLAIRSSKLDAYRALAEQVFGQYLDADTTIGEMMIEDDRFRARVEGVIYGARLVSIEPVGDDSYQTTLSLDQHVVQDLRALYLGYFAHTGNPG
jgi:hypothetical protein